MTALHRSRRSHRTSSRTFCIQHQGFYCLNVSKSAFLKAGTFRLHGNRRISPGDSDVLRTAAAIRIVDTVGRLALDFQAAFRCFKEIAERAALLFIEAAAARITFVLCCLSLYQNRTLTAAVFRIVHTSCYTTVQFCHDFSSCFLPYTAKIVIVHVIRSQQRNLP